MTIGAASGVSSNDTDPEADSTTVALATPPTQEMLDLGFNGAVSYVPTANYFGPDSFTYTASDGLATSGAATVSLTVDQAIPSTAPGSVPRAVAVGDFNGDGNLDVAQVDQGLNKVSIFLGNGSGTLTAGLVPDVSVGSSPVAVAVGDFNGDGKADLAVVNSGSNSVSIRLGNGDGTFQSPIIVSVGGTPVGIAVADFNGDGKADLAVTNSGSNTVSILLGNGNGTFTLASSISVGMNPQGLAAGDFNGDGKQDLAVANSGSGNVSILLGNGNGTFNTPTNVGVGGGPVAITVADLNGDTHPDLAVVNSLSNSVSVLLGDGSGGFSPPTGFSVGSNPQAIAVGNFTGGSLPDLAVANAGSNSVIILSNLGGGQFVSSRTISAISDPMSVASGDFNHDGLADIVAAFSDPLLLFAVGEAPAVFVPNQLTMSADGKYVAAVGTSYQAKVWSVSTGATTLIFNPDKEWNVVSPNIAFAPEKTWVALPDVGQINIRDFVARQAINTVKPNTGQAVAFTPPKSGDGLKLAAVVNQATLVWDIDPKTGAATNKKEYVTERTGPLDFPRKVLFTGDGQVVVMYDHAILVWNLADQKDDVASFGTPAGTRFTDFTVSQDGKFLAIGDSKGNTGLFVKQAAGGKGTWKETV